MRAQNMQRPWGRRVPGGFEGQDGASVAGGEQGSREKREAEVKAERDRGCWKDLGLTKSSSLAIANIPLIFFGLCLVPGTIWYWRQSRPRRAQPCTWGMLGLCKGARSGEFLGLYLGLLSLGPEMGALKGFGSRQIHPFNI